ncbi:hypothetical protein COV03_00610 [Candidatus Uhrbacteria bacterium CG10_big_fil_rev_8_21_14_0_10_41_26]|nr:MAG: hypothetical protein COZ45_02955 [Candidatus Uhrbacteria bacterium CG_4_10_14_3_um_filter_41_21]PIZ54291.1 MAG: hypothetical protein COY24_04185 [Candidatus Uhrbacteria bacterium CG_4_10_14_0_2_um_filter_41_21]PJE75369.1 MAG: hypothetical protein COV03_00610 [Candidatus Uhrbacteria bacterium CG10_big_fil_rev_8_21_14_0_10_41_26]
MEERDFLAPLPVLERVTPDLKILLEDWVTSLPKQDSTGRKLSWRLSVRVDMSDPLCRAVIKASATGGHKNPELFPEPVRAIIRPSAIKWLGRARVRATIRNLTRLCLVGDRLYTLNDKVTEHESIFLLRQAG